MLIGEYRAISRTECDSADTYKYWDQYITKAAYSRGVVLVYWDNG